MLKAGETLHGRYRIERTLGEGGMGRVLLATHLDLNLPVAVKELTVQSTALRASATRQFLSEARILAGLRHPALPCVHDVFEEEDRCFLVMDYIQGCTLEDHLARHGRASEADVLRWGRALCEVLAYLHEHDPPVIFRDLKPSNVMLREDGEICLIDFGIAKELDIGTLSLARGSMSEGFAAPEQYAFTTDARSDIYSLGATLYCLLTGRVPPAVGARIAGGQTLLPVRSVRPQVSRPTARALERMLAPPAALRPQSAREVAVLLEGKRDLPGWLVPGLLGVALVSFILLMVVYASGR